MNNKKIQSLIDILEDSLNNLKDEKIFNNLLSMMHSESMQSIIDEYLLDAEDNSTLNKEDVHLLKLILKVCNSIYNYTGSDTGLTDSQYDSLLEYYKKISDDESLITEPLLDNKNVVHHKYKSLRGTLDKIYKITDEDVIKNPSQKSLDDWINQTEKRYLLNTGKNINLKECDVIVMPKFDGVSCIFEFSKEGILQRALTRGDTSTNEAQDITHIFKNTYSGPIKDSKYPYAIKTEIMFKESDLEELNKLSSREYKNTRSIVSSILNSDERDDRANYLCIVPLRYSYLIDGEESHQYLCDEVYNYPYLKCKLKDVEKIHDFSFNHKYVNPGLRCDGSVIQILDENVQKALGRENEKQKYEVAFKFTEEVAYTKVKDIEFTTGLFGRINPVVVLKPVKLKGNTIERASLGSYARFKDLNLVKGDTVKVYYDIIPYVAFEQDDPHCIREIGKPIEEPLVCLECGKPLELSDTGDTLYCKNETCPSREKGKILNYCKKMNIANISYSTIEDLYREGYLFKIEDLYTLGEYTKEISKLNGYGKKKVKKILDEIESHKDVTPSTLLGSLGIEGISTKTFENILGYITMDEVINICKDNNTEFFTGIPGIKDKTSKKIVKGINSSRGLIEFLRKVLNILPEPKKTSGLFNIVFTKVRCEDGDDIDTFIKDNDGVIQDNVTKSTNIVVVPVKGVTSSKVSKAKKYGIPIVPINELKEYIRTNY